MKQAQVLVFGGNPGSGRDFDALLGAAGLCGSPAVKALNLSGHKSLSELLAAVDRAAPASEETPLVGICYSFGSYVALKWAASRRRSFDRLILVSPTLCVGESISALKRALVSAPWLGGRLLAKLAPKLASEFISKSFAPEAVEAALHEQLWGRLNHAQVWQKAMSLKLIQQAHPLTEDLAPLVKRLCIVRGAADVSVSWSAQLPVLVQAGIAPGEAGVSEHVLAGAGHALPWSRVAELAEIVRAELAEFPLLPGSFPPASAKDAGRIGYHPGETPHNNVIAYLESHLENFPERVALRWVDPKDLAAWQGSHEVALPHREISYAKFGRMIEATAAGLAQLGVQKGDRVIIFLPMNVLMYTAMFAVQRLGAIAVFLDSWARSSHLGASADCARPKAMISHQAAFELIRSVKEFDDMPLRIIAGPGEDPSYKARLEELVQTPGSSEVVAVESEFTALITFTTGSSGTPKGANRTHRFLSAQHEALTRVVPYTPEDSDMPAFPIFSLNNLASGVTTLLPALDLARPSERDAAAMVSQILHEKITCTTLSPSMLNGVSRYCASQGISLPSLRRVVTGGAPISRDDVGHFKNIAPHAEIWVLYGSTEVEPMAHIEAVEMLAYQENPDQDLVEEGVNVGHISEDLEYKFIRIVHDPITLEETSWQDLEVARGEVGEFIVTGDHVCRDYYNNEEAFFKTKILDEKGRVWHRTGDLARIDEQGYLWVVGRIHNVIERAGKYYFPVRAEVILKRVPEVKQCAFLALKDPALGEKTAVAVELADKEASREEVLARIQFLFAKNRIPIDSFYVMDKIPMDPRHHSKVEYSILRDMILREGVDLLCEASALV